MFNRRPFSFGSRKPSVSSESEITAKDGIKNAKHPSALPRGLAVRNSNITTRNAKNVDIQIKEKEKPKRTVIFGGGSSLVPVQDAEHIDMYLQHLERRRAIPKNFLEEGLIDCKMRLILLDWMLHITGKFNLIVETWMLSSMILDRVTVQLKVTRDNLQVVGLACVFLAAKFEEIVVPNVNDFVYMGGDNCTLVDLLKMEKLIIRTLKYNFNFTYPMHYLRKLRCFMASDVHGELHEVAKCCTFIAIMEYSSAHWAPSVIAAVSVYASYFATGRPFDKSLLSVMDMSEEDLRTKAYNLVSNFPHFCGASTKLNGLRSRYKQGKCFSYLRAAVARIEQL